MENVEKKYGKLEKKGKKCGACEKIRNEKKSWRNLEKNNDE